MLAADIPGPAMQRARGTARIGTAIRDGQTELATLYQEGCAKIRLPRTHDRSLQAVLINTAGGLTGGDSISWSAEAAPDARLVLTTQACERIYRSLGPSANVTTRITVGPGAHVDWLPQETILFEESRLARSLEVDLAEGASLCAVEAILLGRDAMGESARRATLADNWRIRRNGRLIHAEATRISGDPEREREGLPLLRGAKAFATVLYAGANAEACAHRVRAVLPDESNIGMSLIGERLIVRALANSGLELRRRIVPIIAMLAAAGGVPRLWSL